MQVIYDAEFDSLTPTKLWCIVCKDIDTGEKYVFRFDKTGWKGEFKNFSKGVTQWIGFNNINFDNPHLNRLIDSRIGIDMGGVLDLLIVSRLVWYSRPGGHGVKVWAKQFGMEKPEIKVYDDPTMIDEYVNRCEHDVEIQHRIYLELLKYLEMPCFEEAIKVEHEIQRICVDMHDNGFDFDVEQAEYLLAVVTNRMFDIEKKMKETIPQIECVDPSYILRKKKDGTPDKRTLEFFGGAVKEFEHGQVILRSHMEHFNPASPKQRIELLNESGWKPTEKTKSHLQCERMLRLAKWKHPDDVDKIEIRLENFKVYGWKTNEKNLESLPDTAPLGACLLAEWLSLEGRRSDVVEWCDAYNPATGRIHGTFNGIGAWTHRMSHKNPNQGNVFSEFRLKQCKDSDNPTPVEKIKLEFNGVLRGLWRAKPGAWLVGADASGIQLRVLAHYIDDEDYTRTTAEGKEEDGTDVHTINSRLLGKVCRSRKDAKVFIYAWLLGAALGKVGEILGCSRVGAGNAVRAFIQNIPGLAELKGGQIPRDAKRGYFVGFDGRKVIVPSEHYVLAGYLQNGESTIMKHANILWREWAVEDEVEFKQVDFVHDEWQTEVYDEDEAEHLGYLQCKAIVQTGVDLGVRCPLAGEYKVGRNWRETH